MADQFTLEEMLELANNESTNLNFSSPDEKSFKEYLSKNKKNIVGLYCSRLDLESEPDSEQEFIPIIFNKPGKVYPQVIRGIVDVPHSMFPKEHFVTGEGYAEELMLYVERVNAQTLNCYLTKAPKRELTDEENAQIDRELDEELPDYLFE